MVAINHTYATRDRGVVVQAAPRPEPPARSWWRRLLKVPVIAALWTALGGLLAVLWTCLIVGAVVALEWLWRQ